MDAEGRRPRRTASRAVDVEDDDFEESGRRKKDRASESSLQLLASRFIEFMERQPQRTADIPSICTGLNIPKRRIYDVTNVLEGVGFLARIGRNAYKWNGYEDYDTAKASIEPEEIVDRCESARRYLASLEEESAALDKAIATVASRISGMLRDPEVNRYMYVHRSELAALPALRGSMALLLEYPLDSTVHFSLPTGGLPPANFPKQERFDILVHSDSGKVRLVPLGGIGYAGQAPVLPPASPTHASHRDDTVDADTEADIDATGPGRRPRSQRKRRRTAAAGRGGLDDSDGQSTEPDDAYLYGPGEYDASRYAPDVDFSDGYEYEDYENSWQPYLGGYHGTVYAHPDDIETDREDYGEGAEGMGAERYGAAAQSKDTARRRGYSDNVGKVKAVSFPAEAGAKRGRKAQQLDTVQDASEAEQEPASKVRRGTARSVRSSRPVEDEEEPEPAPPTSQVTRSGRASRAKPFR